MILFYVYFDTMLQEKDIAKARDVLLQSEKTLGMTVGFCSLLREKVCGVVLAAVDGRVGFSFHLEVGLEFPLHTAAPGKAMLAYLPEQELTRYLEQMDFQKFTPGTITTRTDFEGELESVREKGYGIDVSEQIEGCHCVGVPVFDTERQVVAGFWATAPSSLLPVRHFEQIAEELRKGGQEITSRISSSSRCANRDSISSVIGQAQGIMQNNLNRPLYMEELAANLYVGYSWFRKVFKEQMGTTPAAYHQDLRLEKAKDLLSKTDLSVRQVSERLGFKTQNHFSALFKRKVGMPPSAWR